MRQDVSRKAGAATLFRHSATQSASQQLFASVAVIVPPSGLIGLAIAVLSLLMLGFVAWYVEVPQRATAVGVLMPPDGLLDVVASAPGRVARIDVTEGQDVAAGDLLLTITSDSRQIVGDRLRALHAEFALQTRAHERQLAIDRNRLLDLDEERQSLVRRLAVAKAEHRLLQDQLEISERRLTRRRVLVEKGDLAVDAVEQERSALLQTRARIEAFKHAILEHERGIAGILRARDAAADESARREILHELELRRLRQQIVEQEHLLGYEIRASADGVVARINVRPGAAVIAGQALLKVYRPYGSLEAWLYLSSARAGFLRAGQEVELRLDAYPHQVFGTSSAVVISVSRVAIVPRDINVPLAVSGPVFEVRAKLGQSNIHAFDASWPLAPGTSFQADVVQRRYKLYEWLLRLIRNDTGAPRV